ncbi:MAG: hypothetical protein ACR2IK_12150, partial [Chloroflexota bacterium]
MSVLTRTRITAPIRLGLSGVALLVAALALLSAGTAASAEPAQQAATPTAPPAPTPIGAAQPACVIANQGIQLALGNPQPGDTLLSGVPLNMAGVAYDAASTSGSGIASVTVYLGDRDTGGLSLGIASLGQPNPQAPTGTQFATAGFTLRTPALPSGSGSRTVYVYARSAITNLERVLQVPVFLNTAPTPVKGVVPTAVLPPPPACTPTPAPTAIPTPSAPPAPAAPASPPTPALPTLAPLPTLARPASVVAPPAAAPVPAAPAPAAAAPAPAAASA